ncbi:MAG: VRR-NUC domain-containing protein [Syntrophobacteraceae bacterium]
MNQKRFARTGTEHQHQAALFEWAAIAARRYPELSLMFAIPNGGHRNRVVAAKLKAEGVKPGVSDLMLPVPRGGWHGLFIEMKKPGGKASKDQTAFGAGVTEQGYRFMVCDDWEKARGMIVSYLNEGQPLCLDDKHTCSDGIVDPGASCGVRGCGKSPARAQIMRLARLACAPGGKLRGPTAVVPFKAFGICGPS